MKTYILAAALALGGCTNGKSLRELFDPCSVDFSAGCAASFADPCSWTTSCGLVQTYHYSVKQGGHTTHGTISVY